MGTPGGRDGRRRRAGRGVRVSLLFFFLIIGPPQRSPRRYTLFPYTTLFRSCRSPVRARAPRAPRSRAPLGRSDAAAAHGYRSEEHTSELQSRNDISYAVF